MAEFAEMAQLTCLIGIRQKVLLLILEPVMDIAENGKKSIDDL